MRITNNKITRKYQVFQLLKNGALSSCGSIYFRFTLSQPVSMIKNPSTSPIIRPILTLFMKKPMARPIIIANMNDISARRADGLFSIKTLFFCLMQLNSPSTYMHPAPLQEVL